MDYIFYWLSYIWTTFFTGLVIYGLRFLLAELILMSLEFTSFFYSFACPAVIPMWKTFLHS